MSEKENNVIEVDFVDGRAAVAEATTDKTTEAQEVEETPTPASQVNPLADSLKGLQRMEKKVLAGNKITQQEAFTAMMQVKEVMNALVTDFFHIVQEQGAIDQGLQRLYTLFSVFVELMVRKEVITNDEFKDLYHELVEVPQQEAQKQMMEDAKKASAEATAEKVEDREMPSCHYCGKPDCEFCNNLKKTAGARSRTR